MDKLLSENEGVISGSPFMSSCLTLLFLLYWENAIAFSSGKKVFIQASGSVQQATAHVLLMKKIRPYVPYSLRLSFHFTLTCLRYIFLFLSMKNVVKVKWNTKRKMLNYLYFSIAIYLQNFHDR